MSEHSQTGAVPTDEQAQPEKAPLPARKGLRVDLRNGAAVTGYALDTGGFEWVFTSEDGVMTRVRLSEDATYAIGLIAEGLLDPTGKEAA